MSTPSLASRRSTLSAKISALGTKIVGLKKDFTELQKKTKKVATEADEHLNEAEIQKLRNKIQGNS
ncbi:hypothetical protein KBC54_01505 [Patescibacteria group bacterium]|nr:hypothetical protein [Patescibacteria group bacterium]